MLSVKGARVYTFTMLNDGSPVKTSRTNNAPIKDDIFDKDVSELFEMAEIPPNHPLPGSVAVAICEGEINSTPHIIRVLPIRNVLLQVTTPFDKLPDGLPDLLESIIFPDYSEGIEMWIVDEYGRCLYKSDYDHLHGLLNR